MDRDGRHVRNLWSLPAVTVVRASGSIYFTFSGELVSQPRSERSVEHAQSSGFVGGVEDHLHRRQRDHFFRSLRSTRSVEEPPSSSMDDDQEDYEPMQRSIKSPSADQQNHHYFRSLRSANDHFFRSMKSLDEPGARSVRVPQNHYFRSLRTPPQNHYFRSLRSPAAQQVDHFFRSIKNIPQTDHFFRSMRAPDQDHYFRSLRLPNDHYFRSLRSPQVKNSVTLRSPEQNHYFRSLRVPQDHYFRSLRSPSNHYFRSLKRSAETPEDTEEPISSRSVRSNGDNNHYFRSLRALRTMVGRAAKARDHYFRSMKKRSPAESNSGYEDQFEENDEDIAKWYFN